MGIPNLIGDHGPYDAAAMAEIAKLRHELAVTRAQLGLPAEVPEPPRVTTYRDPSVSPMAALMKALYPTSIDT